MKNRLLAILSLAALAAAASAGAGGKLSAPTASAHVAAQGDYQDKDKDKDKHKHDGDYDAQKDKDRRDDDSEFTERDEFRQSYTLAPGAAVRVSGMNGSVNVETTQGGAAEVYVLRTARSRSDLDYHKVIVEQTGAGLVVRGENNRDADGGWRGENRQVRQRVWLKIPRNVDFTASGINGTASVGELDGPVKLSGINGRVTVAQARGYIDISGINGAVSMLVAQVSERGIRVSGINGSVVLRFDGALNADLAVNGVNGSVNADMPNVTMQGRVTRTSFNAKIGAGGSPISVSGVNGSVKLLPRA
jgi:predicted small lipoprotein YifL